MELDQETIQGLVDRPAEALSVEIKNWIDPASPEGRVKIVRAALALRNRDGGHLVVGFNDKTLQPELSPFVDIRRTFHPDVIQGLVSQYAYDTFEVKVGFGTRDGQDHPVVVIPSGVRVPVAAKANLSPPASKSAIRLGAVYFRSLNANGVPSTAEALPSDWKDIAEICFNNREADFGAFFRRQLAGIAPETIKALFAGFLQLQPSTPAPTPCDIAEAILELGQERFNAAIAERNIPTSEIGFLGLGSWSVGLAIHGDIPPRTANEEFMNLLGASNPRHTGWPPWLDSRTFAAKELRPRVRNGAWEALLLILGDEPFEKVEFLRMDPSGKFFLRRVYEDDLVKRFRGIEPGTTLDPILTISRVGEVIAAGLAFARAMGATPSTTRLGFAFRWAGLRGRVLRSWASPERLIRGDRTAEDDVVGACVEVPLETPSSAIAPYVAAATKDLFAIFDGFTMVDSVIEDLIQKLVRQRF